MSPPLRARGILQDTPAAGAAFGDFDNDGDIDVLVMNMHEAPSLLRNDPKSANHWIKFSFRARSPTAPPSAQRSPSTRRDAPDRAVLSQSSFLSLNDLRLHFGLGAAEKVDKIVVRWPNGETEEFPGAAADALYELKEGSGQASALPLPR